MSQKIKTWLKYIGTGIAGLITILVIIAVIAGNSVTLTADQLTPAGYKRNTSLYLNMADKTRIAVDIWFPPQLKAEQKVPTLIIGTRYGRSYNTGFLYKVLAAFGKVSLDVNLRYDVGLFNKMNYAVMRVDARGSGASSGYRPLEWSNKEITDYSEIMDWIIEQPWSNGKIGSYGVSYDGNSAELLTTTKHPALKAVAPLYSYYDPYLDLIRPGGVFNHWFLEQWSDITYRLDSNTMCRGSAVNCWWRSMISDGIRPVDADKDGRKRAQHYAQRNNPKVYDSIKDVDFRDIEYGQSGQFFDDRSPYRLAADIESSQIPMNVWVGWFDSATVDGALGRYQTLSNPQELVIAPFTHGGKHDTDPYLPHDKPVSPSMDKQYQALVEFFDPLLKDKQRDKKPEKKISYYTMGENAWKTSKQWPPAGIVSKSYFFDAGGTLGETPPRYSEGKMTYKVDYTATSGNKSRWHTINGPDVIYPDRSQQDEKLLVYTSSPLDNDIEITGTPVVHLYLSSTEEDGALHIYLEDLAPDGRVTYLTEGTLRLKNRKLIEQQDMPYTRPGPSRSFLKRDAMPLNPGEVENIPVSLFTISALVKKGHRIRISIAGFDGSVFKRYPEKATPEYSIYSNQIHSSYVELPMKDRL